MQFFFPDSQDQIDPRFDFLREELATQDPPARRVVRPRGPRRSPYDGILLSKAVEDGLGTGGRFTAAHRNRLYRDRVHDFYRLKQPRRRSPAMGDCGAFAYVREPVPPYTVDEVIDFYEGCGFDLGFSVDHIVLGFDLHASPDPDWEERQSLTFDLAAQFLDRHVVRVVRPYPSVWRKAGVLLRTQRQWTDSRTWDTSVSRSAAWLRSETPRNTGDSGRGCRRSPRRGPDSPTRRHTGRQCAALS